MSAQFRFEPKPFFLFLAWFCLRVVTVMFFICSIGVDELVDAAVVVVDVVGGGISAITQLVSNSRSICT